MTGFEKHAQTFYAQDIDGRVLLRLENDDLKSDFKLLTVGERDSLMKAIQEFRKQSQVIHTVVIGAGTQQVVENLLKLFTVAGGVMLWVYNCANVENEDVHSAARRGNEKAVMNILAKESSDVNLIDVRVCLCVCVCLNMGWVRTWCHTSAVSTYVVSNR